MDIKTRHTAWLIGMAIFLLTSGCFESNTGPLKVSDANPRYFTDGTGRAIYLTGSHTWSNLMDMGQDDPPEPFDFEAYLNWLDQYNHNFFRLWTWELMSWNTWANEHDSTVSKVHHVYPLPYMRTGPGKALDGKPKFDLTRFNPEYFQRLRTRAEEAREHGIYLSVMLFEGWGLQRLDDGWVNHPFHPDNNINGIDGDLNGDGKGLEIHTLADTGITSIQKNYVRKVIETVNDLDNILYEISNENHPPSTQWQYYMIDFIHEYEKGKPYQHPVGMTFQYQGGSNRTLFESPADWISPNPEGGYRDDPPAATGRKVIITDTDHLWGTGGDRQWVWKSFTRGINPIYMDCYAAIYCEGENPNDPTMVSVRRNMGYALTYANRVNLVAMTPRPDLCSTSYCLAHPAANGAQYLIYLPSGGSTSVDLSDVSGALSVEWFNPSNGTTSEGGTTLGGSSRSFTPPFRGDAVLYIYQSN